MTHVIPARLGLREIMLLLMIAFTWGSNNVAAHLVSQMSHPLIAAGIRFLITTLCLLPWVRAPRDQLRLLLPIALIGGPLHFGFIYMGFSLSRNIGALTVVMQLWVPLSTLLAIIWLHERPTRVQLAGLSCGFLGILVMSFDPHLIHDLTAALCCFGAAICWATTMVLTRRAAILDGVTVQAWMALLTFPLMFLVGGLADPAAFEKLPHVPPSYWWLTLYAAIGSGVFGNVIVFNIVRKFPVAQTTPLLLCAPLFAMICAAVILHERFGGQEMLGAALVLASVLVIVRARGASV
jgi:O-acetylserine/cysteine efflux transporter